MLGGAECKQRGEEEGVEERAHATVALVPCLLARSRRVSNDVDHSLLTM